MNKMVRKVVLLLAVLMLCCLVFSAAADTEIQQQTVFLLDSFDTASALAYGVVPEHLYPFIYPGSNPYPWVEIDTANCTVGKIYVYNRDSNILTPISSDTAKTYAATADYLYYVTTDNAIRKTDYMGSSIATLYTSSQGSIHNLSAFGNILYFIENGKHLIFLDAVTGNTQLVLTEDDLVSAFVFNEDKLVWYDSQDQAHYYNLTTRQSIVLKNPYEENALIAQYTASEAEKAASNNTMLYASSSQGDSYNDVTFPLPTYPASLGEEEFEDLKAESFFNESYAKSYQCDSFAKYAHDCFWHLEDWDRDGPSWVVNGTTTDDVYGEMVMTNDEDRALVWREKSAKEAQDEGSYIDNPAVVAQFFQELGRGSFVRYGKAKDTTKWDGSHSIVFEKLSDDGAGIIAYESNQDGINGVGYQKYSFGRIHYNYEWILYYVEHDIGSNNICKDTYTHKVCCANCDGYLRQEHSFDFVYLENYSETEHRTNFDCCDGYVYEPHEYYGNMVYKDEFTHLTYCSFCDAYIEEEHSSRSYSPLDETYHSIYFDCCGQVIHESHFTHDYRCLGCGMEFIPTQNVDNEETP
ncbi:MAG: hypothetical protein IJX37_03490 [Oscillospiraceae bacterium]|nr:hypothetical protein [Oscillospiraceae bacterium]